MIENCSFVERITKVRNLDSGRWHVNEPLFLDNWTILPSRDYYNPHLYRDYRDCPARSRQRTKDSRKYAVTSDSVGGFQEKGVQNVMVVLGYMRYDIIP